MTDEDSLISKMGIPELITFVLKGLYEATADFRPRHQTDREWVSYHKYCQIWQIVNGAFQLSVTWVWGLNFKLREGGSARYRIEWVSAEYDIRRNLKLEEYLSETLELN